LTVRVRVVVLAIPGNLVIVVNGYVTVTDTYVGLVALSVVDDTFDAGGGQIPGIPYGLGRNGWSYRSPWPILTAVNRALRAQLVTTIVK